VRKAFNGALYDDDSLSDLLTPLRYLSQLI
jgi:hypothetical protein